MLEEDKGYILYAHTEEGETYEVSVAEDLPCKYNGIDVPLAYTDKFNKAVSDYNRYCKEIRGFQLRGVTSESFQKVMLLSDKAHAEQKRILTILYMSLKEKEGKGMEYKDYGKMLKANWDRVIEEIDGKIKRHIEEEYRKTLLYNDRKEKEEQER